MIVFLYGEDSYRTKQKLDEIIEGYKKSRKSGLNLIYFDAEQKDFFDFSDIFRISPMFSEKKLIILKNVFTSENFREKLSEEVKNLEKSENVIVIYEQGTVDRRIKLFKILTKECKNQEFKPLDNGKLKEWARKDIQKRGATINADALELLIRRTGNDLWQLSGEIQKLANFKENATIKKDDIELLVKPNLESDIFKTIDSLAQKDKKQALSLLYKHMDDGEHPLYLLSMIGYQFRNLLAVKELAEKGLMYASIIQKSGLHPFVVKKTYFLCRQFSFQELKSIYRRIYQIDFDIKSGKIEAETAIDLLVSQI